MGGINTPFYLSANEKKWRRKKGKNTLFIDCLEIVTGIRTITLLMIHIKI